MSSFPLELQHVTSAFAALTWSARAAGGRMLELAAGALQDELGLPVSIRARAVPGEPALALGTEPLVFDLSGTGCQLVAEVDARLASALAALLGGADGRVPVAAAVLPGERAALELLALIVLHGLRAEPCCSPLAPALVRDDPAVRDGLTVVLDVEVGDARGEVRLSVPRRAIVALAAGRCADPPPPPPDVRIAGGWHRGRLTLSRDELSSLVPGDVALLDPDAPHRDALVFDGGLAIAGHVDGDAFTVEERTTMEWNGSFPLALSVEIARITVSLRDLAGVAPGGVLPLQVARDGRVMLRAGDLVVGRGELVEVDGALGVRISSWEERR